MPGNCNTSRLAHCARIALLLLLGVRMVQGAPTNLSWTLQTWRAVDGLPDNTVVGIEQTADGFLWIGTHGGLVSFDGVRFQEFPPANAAGEPTSLIQAVALDRQNRLWIGKDQGVVARVDNERTIAFTAADGLLRQEVRLILEDAQGGMWIPYIGGDMVRLQDGRVQAITAAEGLPDGGTCQLAIGRHGQLWCVKGGTLGVFQGTRFIAKTNVTAQRVYGAHQGGVWLCMATNVSRFHADGRLEYIGGLPTDRPNVTPTVLFEDRSGALWIGTRNGGLFRYDGSIIKSVPSSHHEISCLKEDREGNLWVGTRGGGLNRLRPSMVEVVDLAVGVPGEAVRSVCQDSAGTLWAVTQIGLVTRREPRGWRALSASDHWAERYAQCICANPGGGVWIGTQYKGLHLWQDGRVVTNFAFATGLAGNFVNALLVSGEADLWVGTETADMRGHAVQRWRSGRWQTFTLPANCGTVAAMVADPSGKVWAATSAGRLLRFGEEHYTDETQKTLAVPQAIRCLLSTGDGSLWIGYAGRGVGRVQGNRFSLFDHEQGLPEDYISQIVPDGLGRLWFAGNRGIFSVKLAEFGAVISGQSSILRAVNYGRNEGLPGTQASYGYWPGAMCSADGKLWIPMQSGLTAVDAPGLRENPLPPLVALERAVVDGQSIAIHDFGQRVAIVNSAASLEHEHLEPHLRLHPGYQRIVFEFTALSFAAPANVQFKYRLRHLDLDWVDARGQRVAEYPHIPPGNYVFEVKACNDTGVWSEMAASLTLTAEPHFWQTAWFQIAAPVGAFVLIGAGVLRAVRLRHRRQIERLEMQRATERERARIAQDLHDDLGAGLTQISLNTALAQNPAVTSEMATGLLGEIDHRARELVLALDEIVWAVQPKNDTVSSLARYLCQFAQHSLQPANIDCRLEVTSNLPDVPVNAEQRHQLFLAFKEALHNVIQHSGAAQVRLEIPATEQTFTVILADDGRGFIPGTEREGADGLMNMRERLQGLGGKCEITSEPARGTRVVLRLPLQADKPT